MQNWTLAANTNFTNIHLHKQYLLLCKDGSLKIGQPKYLPSARTIKTHLVFDTHTMEGYIYPDKIAAYIPIEIPQNIIQYVLQQPGWKNKQFTNLYIPTKGEPL